MNLRRRGEKIMQTLGNDLRYGARMLVKKPFFTITAIVTLALGIGANTAIFSVVDAVLLRSLPYHKADALIVLWTVSPSGDNDGVSDLEAQDYRARMQSIEDVTNFQSQSVNVTGGD
jgi:putative ABC transport system permease protein